MDNGQMPQMQRGYSNGMPMIQQVPVQYNEKKNSGFGKAMLIIILSLVSVTFAGLFAWMFMEYTGLKNNFDTRVDAEVARAIDVKTEELETEFASREKAPYRTFSGPTDYGQLSFEYPKTWSVYVAEDASKGGDFIAYFNPIEVEAVSDSTINALRLRIVDRPFDEVSSNYKSYIEGKNARMTMSTISINDFTANRYVGKLPNSNDLEGVIVIFKIRDKTAILRTDSMLFEDDFDRLINTITFNA